MDLKANIESVWNRIENACVKSSRKTGDITLVAVSKKFNKDIVWKGYERGLRNFGENYAQEFRDKYGELGEDFNKGVNWHFVGRLQKNKIKYILGKVCLIHTIDSFSLAKEIDKRASDMGIVANGLIEVNIGGEEAKGGVPLKEFNRLVADTIGFANLKIRGLMGMTPYGLSAEDTRGYFSEMRGLRDKMAKDYSDFREISMGMSDDFEIAIEQGATIIRVGSAIFGPRL